MNTTHDEAVCERALRSSGDYATWPKCVRCGGTGYTGIAVDDSDECQRCHGFGYSPAAEGRNGTS